VLGQTRPAQSAQIGAHDVVRVNEVMPVTPTGEPEFWLNAQKAVDLHEAARHLSSLPKPLLRAG
jgi:plasmid maintenance system antidote protein VapI